MPTYISLSGANCIIPDDEINQRLAGRKDGARPNFFKTQWGSKPGYGWFLVAYSDFAATGKTINSRDHFITFFSPTGTKTVSNLIVTHYESFYRTITAPDDELLLVKVEDARCIKDFTNWAGDAYNVKRRTEADDTSSAYYPTASNTEQYVDGIVDDIWTSASMSTLFGTLSSDISASAHSKVEYVENLTYFGWSGWDAVVDAAHQGALEMTLGVTGEGILFAPNALNSTTLTAEAATYSSALLEASRPTSGDIVKFPETFSVHFPMVYADPLGATDTKIFSPEEAQLFEQYYIKDITTSSVDATLTTISGTKMALFHDKTMREEDTGSNKTTNFDSLATELATSYINSVKNANHPAYLSYSGAIPFPHQLANEIIWHDFDGGIKTALRSKAEVSVSARKDTRPKSITWGFGEAKADATAIASTSISTFKVKPIDQTSGTIDDTSTKEFDAYNIGGQIASGSKVLYLYDPSFEAVVAVPVGAGGYKPLVQFTLTAALATTDGTKTATITAQYGFGEDNTTSSGAITVYNTRTSAGASTYIFEGDSGDYGLAYWNGGTNYIILQMECPA